MNRCLLLLVALPLIGSSPGFAASMFTTRVDDPAVVYLTAQDFGVRGGYTIHRQSTTLEGRSVVPFSGSW